MYEGEREREREKLELKSLPYASLMCSTGLWSCVYVVLNTEGVCFTPWYTFGSCFVSRFLIWSENDSLFLLHPSLCVFFELETNLANMSLFQFCNHRYTNQTNNNSRFPLICCRLSRSISNTMSWPQSQNVFLSCQAWESSISPTTGSPRSQT